MNINRSIKLIHTLSTLRASHWSSAPTTPGYYRWYFPEKSLKQLGFEMITETPEINLHSTQHLDLGRCYCLYFGIAKNLKQRLEWHSAQPLKRSALSSGFLSTFRLSLLALLNLDYNEAGERQLNEFMDQLLIEWVETSSKSDAEAVERAELQGEWTYLINLQNNKTPGAQAHVRELKRKRKEYKAHWLQRIRAL